MEKVKYTLDEMLEYIKGKALQNFADTCFIKHETVQTITISFKRRGRNDIRNWFPPVPFPQFLKKKKLEATT